MKKNCILASIYFILNSFYGLAQDSFGFPLQLPKDYTDLAKNKYDSYSIVNTADWIEKPAGVHGWLKGDKDDYYFEDNTPVKFWGVNICEKQVYPEPSRADLWCAYLTHYGVNAVRFHKFTWCSTKTEAGSTVIDSMLFDRMDYFHSRLKEHGIYIGWSHIYGHRIQPADRKRILAYDEIKNAGSNHLRGSTIGLVHFMPDLQELSIELTVNMLNHINPYTGLRYAEDPALAYIEFQNEDNAFFATSMQMMEACPTYKKAICERFSEWLKKKYKSHESLVNSWGQAFNITKECYPNEHLEHKNINPLPNQWFYSNDCLKRFPNLQKRLYDSARFIFECQQEYYERMKKAIQQTGYKGVLVGSCWQASDNIAHFYNLYSDYSIGPIDRHNYWGGGNGHSMKPGPFNNTSMLTQPGSGLYSTGMQQVSGRPFILSEWMSLIPNEWVAESAPLIALYGLGLQGWDAAYAFTCMNPWISPTIHMGHAGIYNVDSPLQIMLYPALFRMLQHGDILCADEIASCKLYLPNLQFGKLGFDYEVWQDGDKKRFSGPIPPEAMAVGRVNNHFVNKYQKTPKQMQYLKYFNHHKQEYNSSTEQFIWNVSNRGFFQMNTPCSKAFVGFNPNREVAIGDYRIKLDHNNPFGVFLLTSLQKGVTLEKTKGALLVVVARARNTGMRYDLHHEKLLRNGHAPLLIEFVNINLELKRKARIHVLNHLGHRTGKIIEGKKQKLFSINGRKNQTLYYEIEFL